MPAPIHPAHLEPAHLDLGWLDPSLEGLTRRDSSGFGSGLSRALATRLGIDVVLVRVAFVVLGLSGGLGVALYAWGTAVTRGPNGARPIDSLLPGFVTWSLTTQKTVAVISVIVFVACVSAVTSLPWGAGVLALAALLLWRRRGGAAAPADSHVSPLAEGASDTELIDSWRARMARAAATSPAAPPLPEVDLYSAPVPAQPSATRPRASWLAGVGVVAASAAAGAVTLLVFGGNLLTVLAVTCITAGVLSLGFALAVRTRRLPRPVLMLLLAPLVASGWLASVAAVPAATDSSTVQVHAVGESRTVDLRDIDTDVVETIRVTAVDAELEILLPGHVAHSDETLRWSTFSYVPDSPETPAIVPGGLHIDAVLSHITVVESP